jgi:predicted ATP-dependent Lon-type protease
LRNVGCRAKNKPDVSREKGLDERLADVLHEDPNEALMEVFVKETGCKACQGGDLLSIGCSSHGQIGIVHMEDVQTFELCAIENVRVVSSPQKIKEVDLGRCLDSRSAVRVGLTYFHFLHALTQALS